MPRLKAALLSQQNHAAKLAVKKRAAEHEKAKAASVKASSSGAKKGFKKAKRQAVQADGAAPAKGEQAPAKSTISIGDLDVESAAKVRGSVSQAGPSTRATVPFDKLDTILLLGEANFSFAVSVFQHHNHPAQNLLATSYDAENVCYEKYADAKENVETLRRGGVRVEFGVDAGLLEAYDFLWKDMTAVAGNAADVTVGAVTKGKGKGKAKAGRWSRVIFNFPHAGAGITDQDRNIISNQTLLLRTLRSVQGLLTTGRSAFPIQESGKPGRKRKHNEVAKEPEEDDEPVEDEADLAVSDVSDIEDDDPDGEADAQAALASICKVESEPEPEPIMVGPPPMLPPKREGTLLVTLLDQPPYTLWELRRLATKPPQTCPLLHSDMKALRKHALPREVTGRGDVPQPKYRLLRSFAFDPTAYPGYEHRRTIGFKEGVSKRGNEEIVGRKGGPRTWEFAKVASKFHRSR